jgi:hypothetical protein
VIGLNHLLQSEGIDLGRARLVRHQQATAVRSPYDLWMAGDGRFERYQRIQSKDRFKGVDWLVSFVATPLDETLFIGVYRVRGVGTAPPSMIDPISEHDVAGRFFYDIKLDKALQQYRGRIVVYWGPGFRAWVQRPDRQAKAVIEIRRSAVEPPFSGFVAFTWPIRELPSVPRSWQVALSAVSGVYLLICRTTGRHYVGSAYGVGGFWARWEEYFRTGHGGVKELKPLPSHDYQVSILEVASSSLSDDEVVLMEARWKDKLLSRKFGFNRN